MFYNIIKFLFSMVPKKRDFIFDIHRRYGFSFMKREVYFIIYKMTKNIVAKNADMGSAFVVQDRNDHIKEDEKQLGDKDINEQVRNEP